MMFSGLQGMTIPEGVVTQIARDGVVMWKMETSKPIILEVEKITSDTYAGETTYTGEQFILLDIYPKTNGTVNVTYGGLTKTITDTSGAEEPNAQQVFFGTFNGVSDSVTTPVSGEMVIEGDCRGFGVSSYSTSSKLTTRCSCVIAVKDFGCVESIPNSAFSACEKLTSATIPDSVKSMGTGVFLACINLKNVIIPNSITVISTDMFYDCKSLISWDIPNNIKTIGDKAFNGAGIISVEIPASVENIGYVAFGKGFISPAGYNLKTVKMLSKTPPKLGSYTNSSGEILYNNFGDIADENNVLEQIIVPKGCGNAYKTAAGWSTYADYIVEAS